MLGVWSVLDPLRGWDRSVGDKEVGRLGYAVKFKKNIHVIYCGWYYILHVA